MPCDPDGELKSADDWEPVGVHVREGASIGARAVCIAPVSIGRWAMVAAGAVVTHDVPDFALVAGVPARQVRWVGHAGVPLERVAGKTFRCPVTDRRYFEWKGRLDRGRRHRSRPVSPRAHNDGEPPERAVPPKLCGIRHPWVRASPARLAPAHACSGVMGETMMTDRPDSHDTPSGDRPRDGHARPPRTRTGATGVDCE